MCIYMGLILCSIRMHNHCPVDQPDIRLLSIVTCVFCLNVMCLQTIRSLPKNSVRFVPGYGQILWAIECPFLSRNFAKDEITIKNISEVYRNYPFPIQVNPV